MLIRVVLSSAPKKPVRPAKPQALMGKKPAKFALEGNKWAIVRIFVSIVTELTLTSVDCRSIKKMRRR